MKTRMSTQPSLESRLQPVERRPHSRRFARSGADVRMARRLKAGLRTPERRSPTRRVGEQHERAGSETGAPQRMARGLLTLQLAFVIAMACLTSSIFAKEVHSNGLGGGRWSEGTTWKGGMVPTAEDDAVIAARDTVLFDQDDTEKPTCKQLLLDPNSNLAFQSGLGRRTLSVDGPVESYGSIKMHAPGLADMMELRLVAKVATDRVIKLQRGGSLLVLGRANLPEGKRNVILASPIPPGDKSQVPAELTAVGRAMLDLQNAHVDNLHVSASGIDNTGAKPNERINLVGNRFTAFARLSIQGCDTPAIVRNEFRAQKAAMVRPAAMAVVSSPLADIRGNHIIGAYAIGISLSASECSISGNLIEDCAQGISSHTGQPMLKQNVIRNCHTGLSLRTLTGSAEDMLIDRSITAVSLASAKVQLTSITVTNAVTNKVMHLIASSLDMLNCNIRPEQISITPSSAKPKITRGEEPLEAMEFLVVGVKGTVPPQTHVEVVTANPEQPLAPGASDLNIRNSPVLLRGGLTPLPQTLTPIVLKSWRMQEDGVVVPSPEYILNLWVPATEAGAKPRILKTLKLTPSHLWNRPLPNDPKPTLEIELP